MILFNVNSHILALCYDSVVKSVWRYCLLCLLGREYYLAGTVDFSTWIRRRFNLNSTSNFQRFFDSPIKTVEISMSIRNFDDIFLRFSMLFRRRNCPLGIAYSYTLRVERIIKEAGKIISEPRQNCETMYTIVLFKKSPCRCDLGLLLSTPRTIAGLNN